MIKELKKSRVIQEVNNIIKTLRPYYYGSDEFSVIGYYDINENFNYFFVTSRNNSIFVHKSMREYGLDADELFPIIKKITRYEDYNIIWDD